MGHSITPQKVEAFPNEYELDSFNAVPTTELRRNKNNFEIVDADVYIEQPLMRGGPDEDDFRGTPAARVNRAVDETMSAQRHAAEEAEPDYERLIEECHYNNSN